MTIIEMLKNSDKVKGVNQAYQKALNSQTTLNAVVTFVDPKEQLENYNQAGLFAGIPIAVKDNVSTAGIKTTASSKILANYIPVYDATIISRLSNAGAILIAKSSMDELAMGGANLTAATGYVHNPYDLNRVPGGSSGGSAALVAADIVPFAVGSDTGDSVRKPASYCGVVGVKPTYGRISRYGVIPYASSLDHVGYFTRSVEDASLALEVLAGRDDLDMTSSHQPVDNYHAKLNDDVKGKKIAILKNVVDCIDNPVILGQFNNVIDSLKNRGAIIHEVRLNNDLMKAFFPTYMIIANCEASANHSNLDGIRFGVQVDGKTTEEIMINSRTSGLSYNIRKRFVLGSYGLYEDNQGDVFNKAQKIRRLIVDDVNRIMANADILIAPACGGVAPLIDSSEESQLSDDYLITENHMVLANFTGYPSMTLPMGLENNLPLGINITAKAFEEQIMFDVALAIENITGLKDMKAGANYEL